MSRKDIKNKNTGKQENTENLILDISQFKVKNSTNSVIDSELNRIWDYLRNKAEKDVERENLFKEITLFLEKNNFEGSNEEIVEKQITVNTENIQTKTSEIMFDPKVLDKYILDNIAKQFKNSENNPNATISLIINNETFTDVRLEFGYAKKGNIVFFKKAFSEILWHIPNEAVMLTNTGFVVLDDAYWLVIGKN